MGFNTSVSVISLAGGAWPQLTSRVWMLWDEIGIGHRQDVLESIDHTAHSDFVIGFNSDDNLNNITRSIGVSIQEASRLHTDQGGWWFRTGSLAQIPTEPLEIIVADNRDIAAADVPGLLPAVPFGLDSQTIVSNISALLQSGSIDVNASGETTKTGVTIGFQYSARMELFPSDSIADAPYESISVRLTNVTLEFLPGVSVLSTIEASLMNLLRVFILHDVGSSIRAGVESAINRGVAETLARELMAESLPHGVILSLRTIRITPTLIRVAGALGSFGGVTNKLFKPIPTATVTTCFIATAVHGENSQDVELLRTFRDRCLLVTPLGRMFIFWYERLSPAFARRIATSRLLKFVARVFVVSPAVLIARLVMSIR